MSLNKIITMNGTIPYQPFGIGVMMLFVLGLTIVIEAFGVVLFSGKKNMGRFDWFVLVTLLNIGTFLLGITMFLMVGL